MPRGFFHLALAATLMPGLTGCSPLKDWVRKGFKVGPDYRPPPVPAESAWIDDGQPLLATAPVNEGEWWTILGDPVLNDLTRQVRDNNWTLKELGARVLASRAQLDVTKGKFFPQRQAIDGAYSRQVFNFNQGPLPAELLKLLGYDKWFSTGLAAFAVGWEMDFWGKYRRAIESQAAEFDASLAARDQGLVLLQAEVATAYVDYKVAQALGNLSGRIARFEAELVKLSKIKFDEGATSEVDTRTSETAYQTTLAKVRDYELRTRLAMNRLSVLTGRFPTDLEKELGSEGLPALPGKLVTGIPADLIRRRPDLREAERKVAAQSARIGVATSELLPALSLNGTVGVYYNTLGNFASTGSLTGSIGPSFQWNVLNYGRLLAKVRYEDAQFTGAVAALENRVLEAQREVEDGIVRYLKSSEIVDELTKGAVAARRAMELGVTQYRENTQNYLWVYNLERALAGILEQLIQARGQQLQALVETYRALGGGWNLRPEGDEPLPEGNLPQPRPERIESLPLPAVKSSD